MERVIGLEGDLVRRACWLAVQAHSTSNQSFCRSHRSPTSTIFAFRGSGNVKDWYSGSGKPFGNTFVDLTVFPSLKSIGTGDIAGVNAKFFQQFRVLLKENFQLGDRFQDLLKDSQLSKEARLAQYLSQTQRL